MSFPEMLEKSIIVSAHPDDEVLWFSSILDKVNQIVICFISNESNPRWEVGRRKSLMEYPIENIVCLNMDESNLLNGAAWKSPVTTEYGLEIVNQLVPPQRIEKYKSNYESLRDCLGSNWMGIVMCLPTVLGESMDMRNMCRCIGWLNLCKQRCNLISGAPTMLPISRLNSC